MLYNEHMFFHRKRPSNIADMSRLKKGHEEKFIISNDPKLRRRKGS